ncbi:MAG: mechanosensitive ion channel family protein [Clostridiales bacterium]|nr:mechanosensitive ion channel family protein [Eubacteriales bacterium]MDH7567562.1 mechanosensitive ion channel family protein [Clostridiales bacterium]
MRLTHFMDKLKDIFGDFYQPVTVVLEILGIILLSMILVKVGRFAIRKLFEKRRAFKYTADNKRLDTMYSLTVSVYRYVIYIIAGVVILSDVLKSSTVLAAAGIGGVALGFGAQSLIKDMLAGFFIIFENQYVVGDLITIDNMNGTVEEMELRVTKIRNYNGDLYIIPNGEIKKVTNHTRGNKAVIVDIPVAYSTDLGKAVDAANRVCTRVSGEFDTIVEPPEVLGITELGKDSMNLRIMARTYPNEQWAVERRIRMLIREEFGRDNLEFFEKNKIVAEKVCLGGEGANDGKV